ncbi:hypothetical protein DFP72DRAFT_1172165 [Ephemerocybe angulata]|uniref:Uncharacterized protein n=1 Tax=Ephemerocybe angulata TaxID=980116 RepID=A0A8H6HTF5_9AGAR|nr:hypothetical protein DFP72DRAFT_1172165 [Tulosesus angulatus]
MRIPPGTQGDRAIDKAVRPSHGSIQCYGRAMEALGGRRWTMGNSKASDLRVGHSDHGSREIEPGAATTSTTDAHQPETSIPSQDIAHLPWKAKHHSQALDDDGGPRIQSSAGSTSTNTVIREESEGGGR